jgi:hypothetical protein
MLIALSLSLLALQGAPARKPAAPAPLVLEGVWVGEEVGAVGARQPTITFTKDGGTLAYEDATGGTGSFTMRLQGVKVEGTQVRFAVPGGGKLRLWSGRWDGKKITGTIAADASGAQQVGTFELRRPVYEDAPRRTSGTSSSPAAADSAASDSPPASEGQPAASEGSSKSDGDRRREEGEAKLNQSLAKVSEQASQLLVNIQEWQGACRAGGTPLYDQPAVDCDGMIRDIGRLGIAVGRGLEQAEDEARRAGVYPGTVRDLRDMHGLGSSKWDELSSKLRQAEAEWARRKR